MPSNLTRTYEFSTSVPPNTTFDGLFTLPTSITDGREVQAVGQPTLDPYSVVGSIERREQRVSDIEQGTVGSGVDTTVPDTITFPPQWEDNNLDANETVVEGPDFYSCSFLIEYRREFGRQYDRTGLSVSNPFDGRTTEYIIPSGDGTQNNYVTLVGGTTYEDIRGASISFTPSVQQTGEDIRYTMETRAAYTVEEAGVTPRDVVITGDWVWSYDGQVPGSSGQPTRVSGLAGDPFLTNDYQATVTYSGPETLELDVAIDYQYRYPKQESALRYAAAEQSPNDFGIEVYETILADPSDPDLHYDFLRSYVGGQTLAVDVVDPDHPDVPRIGSDPVFSIQHDGTEYALRGRKVI
jgi:hypothetical protein